MSLQKYFDNELEPFEGAPSNSRILWNLGYQVT
jgi:hypothetical protein